MAKFVRDSKLRNVYGQPFKKDQCFDSIRVSKHNNVAMFCAVNPKFMACVTQAAGGGSFLVLPHNKTGRLDVSCPQVIGHKAPVIDIAWSPFNDNLIASCDENGSIMLWEIPDEGLTEPLSEPLCELGKHQKRVCLLKWHPIVENVLLSCGLDGKLYVWNLDDGEELLEVNLPDVVQDMCWNYNGSKFATASKDKKIRIYNPRSGAVEKEFKAHESPREMRIAMLKDNKILTTGFTKMSRRQYTMWDLDKLKEGQELINEELDQTNAPLNIFYDPDLSMAYLVGKGDTVIRYYEINNEAPYFHYITTYQSAVPQRGAGFMPKRGCTVNNCEVSRFYKVTIGSAIGGVEPISFIVPRKSELYQSDVYPDTASNEPTLTMEQWWNGKDATPKSMEMKQFYVEKEGTSSGKSGGLGGLKKKGGLSGVKKVTAPVSAPAASTPAAQPAKKEEPPKLKATTNSWQKPSPAVNSPEEEEAEEETTPQEEEEPEEEEAEPEEETPPPAEKEAESKAKTTPPPSSPRAAPPKQQPNGANDHAPPLDGKLNLKEILKDILTLRSNVSKHEASIEALEEIQANQSGQIDDLLQEIAKLKATVAVQEERIAALEARQ